MQIHWRRLVPYPANHNEYPSVELLWAWEPMYKERVQRNYTGTRSLCLVYTRDVDK